MNNNAMETKKFELVCGDEKMVKTVKINGCTGLAKDVKPHGRLRAIVKGTGQETGKVTYYLCMNTDEGFGIYATQVEREISRISDVMQDAENYVIIACTEGISRSTGQKFFKINVEDFQ